MGEVFRNHTVITCRQTKDLRSTPCTKIQVCFTLGFKLFDQSRIILSVTDDRGELMILCGTSKHRRSTDIDVFNGFFMGEIYFRNRLLEGIEIHNDVVDRMNRMFIDLCLMFRQIPSIEQSSMDLRVECFDTSIQHLRKLRDLLDT